MASRKERAKFYVDALARLGLSQAKASIFFGFSTRKSRRIVGCHTDLPQAEEMLLKVMLHTGLTVDAVKKICNPDGEPAPKKAPRRAAAATAT